MSITHKRLGKHGVLVSNLCLGTMNFGWHTSEDDSRAIMDRALELGVNFFDTADVYGWVVEHGLTEEIIGRWFAQGGGRREAVVLATKVFNPVNRKTNLREVNSDGSSLSAYKIRKHCEGSLKRLQTDHIDLYQLHRPDPTVPYEESVGALGELRDEGKIRLIGISNVSLDQLRAAQSVASIASVQNRYNLHERTSEDVLRACEADNVAFLPYYPIKGWSGSSRGIKALREVGAAHDATAAAASLAWLLARSPVMLPIPGTSSLAHLEENVSAAFLELTEAEVERLDAYNPAISSKLDQLRGPLSPAGRAKVREAAGPLRKFFQRLRFWD